MGTIGREELASWDRRMEDGGSIIIGDGGGGSTGGKEERILVSVRLRPQSEKEIVNRDPCDWECINETTIIFRNSLPERSMFPIAYNFGTCISCCVKESEILLNFKCSTKASPTNALVFLAFWVTDKVFNPESTTRRVYEEAAKEVAMSVVSGINSSIFAYGQTSSGKTYTMSGITEYSVADIYDYIQRHEERVFVLKFSAIEIYNEAVRDLLSSDSTPLRLLDDHERGTIVEKLKEETLRDCNHLKELLSICEAQRQIGETSLNENSSRSHQILRLTIESSAREFLGKENSSTLVASVNFVDLAGSERASQAMSAGARLKEGCHINRSLLTLGTVIRKLSKERNGHIPYRDSKLTRILQPSLGGNARTAIVCTMSPSRSHIEQSRNTLLFASCAKEVVTSANVNVVMSDKALVKQLQRELARLENELRQPCPPSNVSRAEALLKEKDIQIHKMEKEIKELMQQRDLAQSRLENLLQSVGDDQLSGHWGNREPSVSHSRNTFEEENSISESSVSYHDVDFSITKLSMCPDSEDDINAFSDLDGFQKHSRRQLVSPSFSIKNSDFVGKENISLNNSEEFEDLCKEVHCIEMDESSTSKTNALSTRSNGLLPLSEVSSEVEEKLVPNLERIKYPGNQVSGVADVYSSNQVPIACTLEKQLQTADSLDKRSLDEQSPWELNSRSSVLSRSRSCKPSVSLNSSSPWFVDEEENQNTPPSTSLMDFFGRPEGLQRRVHALNYGAEGLLGEGSQSSESRASADANGDKLLKSTSEEDISGICDSAAGMKMMNQTPHANDKEREEKCYDDLGTESMVADPKDPCTSPSARVFEFEKQQQDIIVLWHDCNVSLVHRTYFFLLFKGDPADSIYLEVEFRRLTFLKQTFENGDVQKPMIEDGSIVTPALSVKALRREREMLSRKMKRRLSSMERRALYREWGIALDSKQRRLQLAHLLWSETKDMNHIRESASIIAKLVGLLEPGQALKEMFELTFTLQRNSRRWRY